MYISVFISLFISSSITYAQEPEVSADVSNEIVTDAFQEQFFEGLKQHAIENYEKAIAAFLNCKNIDPENTVVDFELGKNYLKLHQYYKAEDHILKAVNADPANTWYLDVLFKVYEMQNATHKAIELAERLADTNDRYKESLASLYTRSGAFDKALTLLDELDAEQGVTVSRRNLRSQLLARKNSRVSAIKQSVVENTDPLPVQNPLETIQTEIDRLQSISDFKALEEFTDEALETYPSQSAFYYANAFAKNKLSKHKDAIYSLEMALEFLLGNPSLEQRIYGQMIIAYTGLGNLEKVREYEKKMKKGS
ncbi:hypothetical protein [Ascidiimonas aurantiaca]|uniref:tetratricopeptide repeat protein n=1 Tax=Ascidiimonas aurantiaca TaxID=1685432 RepID=UPI0030EB5BCA